MPASMFSGLPWNVVERAYTARSSLGRGSARPAPPVDPAYSAMRADAIVRLRFLVVSSLGAGVGSCCSPAWGAAPRPGLSRSSIPDLHDRLRATGDLELGEDARHVVPHG